MPIRAGKLDRSIRIVAISESVSASGAALKSEALFANARAEVVPDSGSEEGEGERDQARSNKTFRIRWLSGLTNKHVIVYEGVRYDILSINEIERREGHEIVAVAKVN